LQAAALRRATHQSPKALSAIKLVTSLDGVVFALVENNVA